MWQWECVDSFVIASTLTVKEEIGSPTELSRCDYIGGLTIEKQV